MLKFLTHKLRTHSLNEENVCGKVEERDSGTESDDEADRDNGDFCTDVIMKWNDITDIRLSGESCACAPEPEQMLPEPEPDHLYDHHSSEEELEVINSAPPAPTTPAQESRRRGASSPPPAAPEKRRATSAQPYDTDDCEPARVEDDEDEIETPVRFRSSPPLEILNPWLDPFPFDLASPGSVCSERSEMSELSDRSELSDLSERCDRSVRSDRSERSERSVRSERSERSERAPSSPRRRRMALPPPRRNRPALDFDKMQQLRVGGGVRSWRAVGGAHGGELSVFCW